MAKQQIIQNYINSNMAGIDLSLKNFSFTYSQSIQDINADWDIAAPDDNLFLNRTYLSLLEKNPPEGMRFCYLVFYKNQRPIGISACQIQGFNAEQSLQKKETTAEMSKTACFFTAMGNYMKSVVASKMDFDSLICGNVLLTGEHGFYFNAQEVKQNEAFKIVEEALEKMRKDLRKNGTDISVTLVKDYYTSSKVNAECLKEKRYNEFTIQPNMVMDIRPDWKTFDDYKAAMFSKYRVRVKRAAKKGQDFVKREMTAEDIEANLDLMYDLYEGIAISAGFNVAKLNKRYFLALKEALQERFILMGYYLDDKLVGFYTLIRNHHELEAHFLGFDKSKNASHQIYLNMLYDMVRTGIDEGFQKIVFARTALEIKSSVGAVAHDMFCYMRHKYNLSNKFFTPIYDYLKPDLDWQPRHPFKEE